MMIMLFVSLSEERKSVAYLYSGHPAEDPARI